MASKTTIHKKSSEYYDLRPLLKTGAQLKIVYSDRSNGKTYATLKWCIEQWWKNHRQTFYLRRYREFFKDRKNVDTFFDNLIGNGEIEKITEGRYKTVHRIGQIWYLANKETSQDGKTKIEKQDEPFFYGGSFTETENLKSGFSAPNCSIFFFDEFLATADQYIDGEFELFQNILSTVKRNKPDKDFDIILSGNTLNPHGNPYFRHFGIVSPEKQAIGTIQLYKIPIGDTGRDYLMAVERAPLAGAKTKVIDDFFLAFDSPTARMTTSGEWEVPEYHLINATYDVLTKENVLFTFYVKYDDDNVQCDVVKDRNGVYVFAHEMSHRKKLDANKDLIYTDIYSIRSNIRAPWCSRFSKIDKKIDDLYRQDRFVFDDNSTGLLIDTFCKLE